MAAPALTKDSSSATTWPKEGLTESEVLQALWEHGVDDLVAVTSAVLEVDGTISVVPRDAPSSHTRRIRGRKPVGKAADVQHGGPKTVRDRLQRWSPGYGSSSAIPRNARGDLNVRRSVRGYATCHEWKGR